MTKVISRHMDFWSRLFPNRSRYPIRLAYKSFWIERLASGKRSLETNVTIWSIVLKKCAVALGEIR
jgi:hypothetical protein